MATEEALTHLVSCSPVLSLRAQGTNGGVGCCRCLALREAPDKCRLSEAFLIEGAPGMRACDSVTPNYPSQKEDPEQYHWWGRGSVKVDAPRDWLVS
jgi:hypothetical protein